MGNLDQFLFAPSIEKALLGGILMDSGRALAVFMLRGVKPEAFYIGRHALIYRTMLEMHKASLPIDPVTLAGLLQKKGLLEQSGGYDYLLSLIDALSSPSKMSGYLDMLLEMHRLRTLRDSAAVIDDMIASGRNSSDISARVVAGIVSGMEYDAVEEPSVTLDRSLMDFANAKKGQFPGYPPFIPAVGEILGVYVPGNMYVLGARPSDGKSTWAQNETLHMAMDCGLPCAFASMEMSAKLLREMMMGALANVSIYNARLGLFTDSQLQRLHEAKAVLEKLPIFVDDRRMTIEELVAWITYIVHRQKVKFVAVDYLQLMRPSHHKRGDRSRNEEVLEWSARLKEVTKRLDIVTLVLSQLSRSGDRIVTKTPPPPTLEAFRDSGGIEQDADGAIFVYKEPDIEATEFFGDKDWRMEVCVAKNRIGPTGTRPVRFVRRRQVFEGVDKYEARVAGEVQAPAQVFGQK